MKLIAAADLHGKGDRLRAIAEQVVAQQADVLVIAGDLAGRRTVVKITEKLAKLVIPVLVVTGNSDAPTLLGEMRKYDNLIDLHLHQIQVAGVPFIGLSGTVPLPFYNKIGFREKKLLQQLQQVMSNPMILVTHTPPRYSVDKVLGRFHAGSNGLKRLIDQTQPRLVLCGHIHEAAGVAYRRSSCIVNCSVGNGGNGVLVEMSDAGEIQTITQL